MGTSTSAFRGTHPLKYVISWNISFTLITSKAHGEAVSLQSRGKAVSVWQSPHGVPARRKQNCQIPEANLKPVCCSDVNQQEKEPLIFMKTQCTKLPSSKTIKRSNAK